MKHALYACAVAGAVLSGTSASAAPVCQKDAIEMVVTLAAGTGIDVATRILAEKMSRILGTHIVIVNLPGADGEIGATRVHRAHPDGCTLGSLPSGSLVAVTLTKRIRGHPLPYDPLRGFTPIGKTFGFAFVIGVTDRFPDPSVEAVVAHLRANPSGLKLAVSVPPHDLALGLFKRHYGVAVTAVPYRRGDVTAVADLLSGVLDGSIMTVNAALPHIESGKYKPLAVFARTRHPHLPMVRTFEELGVKETSVVVPIQGLFGPPGLPAWKVEALNAALKEALADEEVAQRLLKQGTTPDPSSPQELISGIEAQLQAWSVLLDQKVIELR